MAIIMCPECGKKVSDQAVRCPHCGLPQEYILQHIDKNNYPEINQEKHDFTNAPDHKHVEKSEGLLGSINNKEDNIEKAISTPKRSNKRLAVIGIITILCCVLFGGYYIFTSNNIVIDDPKQVNTISTKDDAETLIEAQNEDISLHIQDACSFLHTLYDKYVFGREDFNQVAPNILTPEISQLLIEEIDGGERYAIERFRTGRQDGPGDVSKVYNVKHIGDNWFRVYYVDMGLGSETDIQLEMHNGSMRIVDMRSEEIDYYKKLNSK